MRSRRRHRRFPQLQTLESRLFLSAAYLADAVSYATASNPTALTVADFNSDGAPDVAVAATNSHVISLLLNLKTYDGTFAPRVDLPVGANPVGIVAADFNGDGKLDLAVAEQGAKAVGILLNLGNGAFAAEIQTSVGYDVDAIVAADFNADGKLDVAVVGAMGSMSLLRGNGNGTFQPKSDYATGAFPSAITAGDFNGDGKADVALTTSSNINVFLNNGSGGFAPRTNYATDSGPGPIVAADLNNDGVLDLATANWSGTVSVLRGNGNGTFALHVDYKAHSSPKGIVAADFDGDGKLDLATTNYDHSGHALILRNLGSGLFSPGVEYGVETAVSNLAAGDFDLDGAPDLAVTGTSPATVTIVTNGGAGVFAAVQCYSGFNGPSQLQTPDGAVIRDFNGDGKNDIAVVQGIPSAIGVLLNNGDGTFAPPVSYPTGKSPKSIAAGDFDKDGDIDLVVCNSADSTLSLLLNNGDGTFAHNVDYPTVASPLSLTAADFNADGKMDLAVLGGGAIQFSVHLGDGAGNFAAPIPYATGNFTETITSADVNNDNKPDIIVNASPGISVYLNSGTGTFPTRADYTAGAFANSVTAADFNNDGLLDLVAAEGFNSSYIVLMNTGGGVFSPGVRTSLGVAPTSVAAADLTRDGKTDLVVGLGSDVIRVLAGNGDGTFGSPLEFAAYRQVEFVVTGMLDSDAAADVAYLTFGDTVHALLNQVTGTARPRALNFSRSGSEDATLTFASTDFSGAFVGAGALSNIKFGVLPKKGTLYVNSVAAGVGIAYPASATITYVPNAGFYGTDTFTWRGSSNGVDFSARAATTTLTISHVNHAPGNITLSSAALAENNAPGATLGNVSAADADAGDTFTYALVGGDTGAFSITGATIKAIGTLNFESKSSYTLTVRATDQGGLWFEKTFGIAVNDVNEAPAASGFAAAVQLGATLTFGSSQFTSAFADVDTGAMPHLLSKIQIKTLPGHGTLRLFGVNISTNQEIAAGELGNITYLPAAGYAGADSFTFAASDGSLYSAPATVSITISAPEIGVSGNGLNIGAGDYMPTLTDGTNFGSVLVNGTAIERTFTISNSGTLDLTIGTLSVPVGFVLTKAPDATVAPGGSTTFVVAMDMAVGAGIHKGQVSFATNDNTGGENPFAFTVTALTMPIDESTKNTVKVTATKPKASEAGTPGLFTFTRAGGVLSEALTVKFEVTGAATPGDDFATLPSEITIPAGATKATLDLSAVLDSLAEGPETVVVTLVNDSQSSYKISPIGWRAAATIADAASTITVTAADPVASEINGATTGGGRFLFRRMGGSVAEALTIHYTLSGTASNDGSDFAPLSGDVTFAPGASLATVNVAPIDDFSIEGKETLIASVAADPSYFVGPSLRPATITIADDNRRPTIGGPAALSGAAAGVPFVITYQDLIGATGVVDSEGQPITIKIVSVLKGKLLKNGVAVRPGITTLVAGEWLTWLPPLVPATYLAFKVSASDGVFSTLAAPINILVA